MAVTYFSKHLGQKKDLYRANKKISGIEYQEYFNKKSDADARQVELEAMSTNSDFWRLRNDFVQSGGIGENCASGGNIGIRHVYFRIPEIRKGSGTRYPAVEVSVSGSLVKKGVVIKSFPLSTYGWPGALIEAITYSFNITVAKKDGISDINLLEQALLWAEYNDDELSSKLWGMMSDSKEQVFINSEYSRNSKIIHMGLSESKSGSLTVRVGLPSGSKSKVITDYNMLFHTAAYFVALQIMHREFDEESSYESYAYGIYFMLKGDWMVKMHEKGYDCNDQIEQHGLNIDKWRLLVNQWSVSEYGSELLK